MLGRRAIVLFVPEPIAPRVDEIRRRWDPVMTARIDAHVTLVHEVTDHDAATRRVEEVAALTASLAVTLTTTRCWSRASYGVYLDVDDPAGAVGALHAQLADVEAPGADGLVRRAPGDRHHRARRGDGLALGAPSPVRVRPLTSPGCARRRPSRGR